MKRARYLEQTLVFGAVRLITVLVLAILAFVLLYVFVRGIGAASSLSFWTEAPREGLASGGILPPIIGTLALTVLSMTAACLVGVPAGIYMSEFPMPGKVKVFIDIMTNNLAGIPSIVFGLFGMSLFVIGFGFGDSLAAGGLTLAIMVLPVIIRTTEQAMAGVPQDLRVAALGMGATRIQTIWRVALPVAIPRILTGVILSIGRVAGETAPILFTVAALYLPNLPTGVFDQAMALPYHLYVLSVSSPEPDKSLPMAFGTALALLLIVMIMNAIATVIRKRYARKFRIN